MLLKSSQKCETFETIPSSPHAVFVVVYVEDRYAFLLAYLAIPLVSFRSDLPCSDTNKCAVPQVVFSVMSCHPVRSALQYCFASTRISLPYARQAIDQCRLGT